MHPKLDELQKLNQLDFNEVNAQKFLKYLTETFRDGWEGKPAIEKEVKAFQKKLDTVNDSWATDIKIALQNSQSERSALAVEVSPRPKAKPSQNTVSAWVPESGDSLIGEESLAKIEISPQEAYLAGEEFIGKPLNAAKIQKYQTSQNLLPADGVIGAHTYLEIATPFLTKKVLDRIDTLGISQKTQTEVEFYFANANLTGKNMLILKNELLGFQERHKNDTDFDERYALFFKNIEISTQKYTQTPNEAKPNQNNTPEAIPMVPVGEKATLSSLNVAKSTAQKLGENIIGTPLTEDKIKKYQADHEIGADGLIGAETYLEMEADRIVRGMRVQKEDFIYKNQDAIISVLQNGKPIGVSYRGMSGEISSFRKTFNNTSGRFNNFFQKLDAFMEKPEVNPYLAEIKNEANKVNISEKGNSDGLLGDIPKLISGEMNPKDYINKYKSPVAVVMLLAFAFFGNKIPGFSSIPGSGSWMTRIPMTLAFLATGGMKLADYGFNKVVEGVENGTGYVRSPKAAEQFKKGENWFTETWNSATNEENYGIGINKAKEVFGNTILGMEGVNEKFKNSEAGKYISEFTGKSSIILSDSSFQNATKKQVLNIKDKTGLSSIMSSEKFEEIKKLDLTDADVENFITLHMKPKLENISDNELVKKSIWYQSAVSIIEDLAFNENTPLNSNPKIDAHLKNEFATIINGRGSETLKEAAKKLAAATQNNTLDNFNLDNDFKSLSLNKVTINGIETDEKALIDALLIQVKAIRDIGVYITNETRKIQAIEVKTEGLKDNTDTIQEDMKDLNAINSKFSINTGLISYSGLVVTDFDRSSFDATYTAKRLEILTYAKSLSMKEIDGVADIDIELGKVETEKKILEQETEVGNIINNKLEDLPPENSTPLVLRDWYNKNIIHINKLKDIKNDVDSANTKLIDQIDIALKIENQFIERYKIVREKTKIRVSELSTTLTKIASQSVDSPIDFGKRQQEILDYTKEYNKLIREIDSETGVYIKAIWKDLFSYETFTASRESNAIYDLDDKLKLTGTIDDIGIVGLKEQLRTTVRGIEEKFSVDINADSIDVSKPETIASAIRRLKRLEIITSRGGLTFANTDILESKKNEISKQIDILHLKFITAIGKTESQDELGDIYSRYKVFLEGEFSGSWKNIKLAVGYEKDPVVEAYETKLIEIKENKAKITLEQLETKKVNLEKERLEKIEVLENHITGPIEFLLDRLKTEGVTFPTNAFVISEKFNGYLIDGTELSDEQKEAIELVIANLKK